MTQQQALLSWFKDAHAMEVGAVSTLQSHAAAASDYPDVQAKLNEHADVTRRHAHLIEGCIARLGGHPSALKEAVGTLMGQAKGIANLPAKDTIIKNALSDYAAENFEIACYKSLIAGAEMLGDKETVDVCKQILRDEEEMGGWLGGHIATVTLAFVSEQSAEANQGSDGLLDDVERSVAGMGKKGKELISNAGPDGVLLTSGALLLGVGVALLVGQTRQGSSSEDY